MCLQNDAFATYRETEIVPAGDVFNVFLSTATFVVDDLQLKTTQEICLTDETRHLYTRMKWRFKNNTTQRQQK